jgi:hypothetical protein
MAPRVMEESDVDLVNEEVDAVMDAQEQQQAFEAVAAAPESATQSVADLSDGGRVGGATLRPTEQHQQVTKGRAVARRAWSWNGSESLLTLAWNPDGTANDGARHYLQKRFCTCCSTAGHLPVKGVRVCRTCRANSCTMCLNADQVNSAKLIPNFYLRKEDVPFPEVFYGNIDCFLPFCPRHETRGFKTEQDMRVHARTRHRLEYQAHLDTLKETSPEDIALMVDKALQKRLAELGNGGGLTQTTIPEAEESQQEPVAEEHRHRYGKQLGSPCKVEGCTAQRQMAYAKRT